MSEEIPSTQDLTLFNEQNPLFGSLVMAVFFENMLFSFKNRLNPFLLEK